MIFYIFMSVKFFLDTRPTETCRTTNVVTNTPVSSAHSLFKTKHYLLFLWQG